MKRPLTHCLSITGKACRMLFLCRTKNSFLALFFLPLMMFLLTGISVLKAQDYCDVKKGWWDDKYLTLKSGIEDGDTIHWESCQVPWNISATDLKYYHYLKYEHCERRYAVPIVKRQVIGGPVIVKSPYLFGYGYRGCLKIKTFCYRVDVPEDAPEGMYQLWKYEYVIEDVYCQRTYTTSYYLALYDHAGPVYECFPNDTTVTSASEMPPVDEKVKIMDVCQYVDWWNVTMEAIVDSASGDTTGYVRRWSAGDPSGNESYKEQKIWFSSSDGDDSSLKFAGLESKNYSQKKDWTVYPNPSKNVVYIGINSDDKLRYTVYDVMGRSVKNGTFYRGQSIRLDHLKAGVYHLQLQNRDQLLGTKKLIINY